MCNLYAVNNSPQTITQLQDCKVKQYVTYLLVHPASFVWKSPLSGNKEIQIYNLSQKNCMSCQNYQGREPKTGDLNGSDQSVQCSSQILEHQHPIQTVN